MTCRCHDGIVLRQISLLFQFLTDSCLYLLEARGEDLNSSADILVCSREIDFELVFHIFLCVFNNTWGEGEIGGFGKTFDAFSTELCSEKL